MSAICEEGSGATRLCIPATLCQYVTADIPETTTVFPASQEIVMDSNPNYSTSPIPEKNKPSSLYPSH